MTRPARLLRSVLPVAFLALAGCGSLLGARGEAPTVLAPQVQVRTDPAWPQVDWQLAIATPQSSESLATSRIAVQPQPGTLEVYAGALWLDTAPELVQNALIRGFEDSGKILAVSGFGGGVRGDFALLLDLRHFESIYRDGTPEATVELRARLVHFRGNRVVAARTFRNAVPAQGVEVARVSDAFGQALSATVTDVVGWTLVEGQQAVATLEAGDRPATRTPAPPRPL